MEFNPLDLLASAAELQYKDDDSHGSSVNTPQLQQNSALGSAAQTKGNKDTHLNNNNNLKGKSATVVRKIKLTPELEKMLNEHNYGNAKRNEKYGNHINVVIESGERTDRRLPDECGDRDPTAHPGPQHVQPERIKSTDVSCTGAQTDSLTQTNAQTIDLGIVSPVEAGSSRVESGETECKCGGKRQSQGCKSDLDDSGSVCTCACKTPGSNLDSGCCEALSTLSTTDEASCDCSRSQSQLTDVRSHVSVEINNQTTDRLRGQTPDTVDTDCVVHCVNKHSSAPVDQDDSRLSSDTTTPSTVDTGECCTSTAQYSHMLNRQANNECSHSSLESPCEQCLDINTNTDTCTDSHAETDDDSNWRENLSPSSVCIDFPDKKGRLSGLVTGNVRKLDTTSTELDSKVSLSELGTSTSMPGPSQRVPFVKVITSEVVREAKLEQPPTLVINISNKSHCVRKLVHKSGTLETIDLKLQNLGSDESKDSKVGLIRKLLTPDMSKKQNGNISGKPALTIPKCDRLDFAEKSDSCDSLKSLELSDSMCTDGSNTSVHLLSPDRRNPDSMGIAESPVTSVMPELSCPSDCGDSDPVDENDVGNGSDSPMESQESVSMDTSVINGAEDCSSRSEPSANANEESELLKDSRLISTPCCGSEESANVDNFGSECDNEAPIFRFESDHCYAGVPGKVSEGPVKEQADQPLIADVESAGNMAETVNTGTVSQNEQEKEEKLSAILQTDSLPRAGKPSEGNMVKNLVPVLLSVNKSGCLTVHKDSIVPGKLSSQMFALDSSPVFDSGMTLLSGTSLSSTRTTPLILSPVGANNTAPVLVTNPPMLVPASPDILGLVGAKTKEIATTPKLNTSPDQISPPKFGSYKIGTVGAVSNSDMGLEDHLKSAPAPNQQLKALPILKPAPATKTASAKTSSKAVTPPVVDTLGTLVQKVRSNLSPASQIDFKNVDHIQHDHDYCMKNLMPSVVNSVLEAKLQKDIAKGKVAHSKLKKSDLDSQKNETKSSKRKRTVLTATKEETGDFECDGEEEVNDFSYSHEFVRPKTRAEKYIEQKSAEPKVKITGSSNFQDQFVYFMNTKKRSRRRESRDSPIPIPIDRLFIPPKPGDIVVPHLTDQDIENLKTLAKQAKGGTGANSVRSEFMAAKLSGLNSTQNPQTSSQGSQGNSSEVSVDDEKNIINTILSLENENLSSPEQPYNASMEMYGQGLGGDIMNLLPEQMNLTQEQMDLLFSAVDEVQNSSPGLIGAEKLVSSDTGDSTFGQFPVSSQFDSPMEVNVETEKPAESDTPTGVMPGTPAETTQGEEKSSVEAISTDAETEKKEDVSPSSPNLEEASSVPPEEENTEQDGHLATLQAGQPVLASKDQDQKDNITMPTGSSDSISPQYSLPTTCSDVSTSVCESKSESVSQPGISSVVCSESNVTESSVVKPLIPSSLSLTSVNIPSSLSTEISLPSLDKTSLDLLNNVNEFRLDKNDLFPEASVPHSSVVAPANVPAPVPSTAPMDMYSAPWIVTVSMFWNDLPAIMINNSPFVRLVDIHKQILPAKDTGILKKRCQLMGIEVDNCSEMQRYFLVQYGKAFNSKSTLIISKDDAKELIGYYVNPQPKTTKADDHKSIIDHRREQLRRIALARRAAMRAQRATDKRDEDDPRAIREPTNSGQDAALPDKIYSEEPSPAVSVPKSPLPTSVKAVPITTPNITAPRATRQKKINFLEMLRGDTNIGAEEETAAEAPVTKKQKVKSVETKESSGKTPREKKVKIVKYIVETDSSETESNESESEYSTTDLSVSSESEDFVMLQKSSKHKGSGYEKIKSKVKTKIVPSKNQKGPLKVKIGTNKRVKPLSMGTQVGVKIMKKSVGTLSPPVSVCKFRSKTVQRERSASPHTRNYSPPIIVSKRVMTPPVVASRSSTPVPSRSGSSSPLLQRSFTPYVDSSLVNDPSLDHPGLAIDDPLQVRTITGDELKVTPVLPKEILADTESSDTKEVETNTDYDQMDSDQSGYREIELVNEATNTSDLSGDTVILDNSDSEISHEDLNGVMQGKQVIGMPAETSMESKRNGGINTTPHRQMNSVSADDSLQSVNDAESSSLAMIKRKQITQVINTEVPLKIVHRDTSPQDSMSRHRSQLGEAFVERYNNKKSLCVRCYTCRKMMSVDSFLRHLHDVVTGGLLSLSETRIISASDPELTDTELKLWEAFQRKKELFDNNQLPSPDVAYAVDSDSNHSAPELVTPIDSDTNGMLKMGPLVKTTPVSPLKQNKIGTVKPRTSVPGRRISHPSVEHVEATRTSSRKRKMKQLYPFEEYSFGKFPRLQNEKASKSDV